jgi:anti-anti-sigma regulatory factor
VTTTVAAESGDQQQAPSPGFDVRTARCDATRANLHVSGDLSGDGAAVLAHVIDGHLRAGRRFLRLHIGGARTLGESAIAVIADAHQQLLARRGTMILTGVTPAMEDVLRAATPTSPLLMLRPTAAELNA